MKPASRAASSVVSDRLCRNVRKCETCDEGLLAV
jgi:hypothetical protein